MIQNFNDYNKNKITFKQVLAFDEFKVNESRKEDLDLYNSAKEAYYNGNPIMGDVEFDELEKQLGLENKGNIGTYHAAAYTIKHPIKMGSLSKVQIKNSEIDNSVHFDTYINILLKYFSNIPENGFIEVTPKFDGCSFEVVYNDNGELESVSTRGDGEYGKDIKIWLEPHLNKIPHEKFIQANKKLVIRGEVLVDFDKFKQYSTKFSNTRSFVAGILGQDLENTTEQIKNRNDLSIIVYDFRYINSSGSYQWIDYNSVPGFETLGYNILKFKKSELTESKFAEIYSKMEDLRKSYKFPLDGFVMKPEVAYRKTENIERPTDSVAIKFLPTILETEIIDIEWNVGKTMELFPKAIFKTVIMDGKKINKASLHNYGFVIKNNIGIGSKIKISLAGDIIPFVYEVVSTGGDNKVPTIGVTIKDKHLMLDMSTEDKIALRVKAGAEALNIRGLKEATVNKICPEFLANVDKKLETVLDLMRDENLDFIIEHLGNSVSTMNIVNALKERRETLTLSEVILAMQLPLCGSRISELCSSFIKGAIQEVGLIGVSGIVKSWLLNKNSVEYITIMDYVNEFNVDISVSSNTETSGIQVIMTGSPKEFGYATKSVFLQSNPKYIETSDWKICKILFTDDLSSDSSKMQKAKKLGIEIKTYDQA